MFKSLEVSLDDCIVDLDAVEVRLQQALKGWRLTGAMQKRDRLLFCFEKSRGADLWRLRPLRSAGSAQLRDDIEAHWRGDQILLTAFWLNDNEAIGLFRDEKGKRS
ncbi:MAG: hypothetical protein RL095_3912 [Verrucomicrobiota bacterium]|jgi:hypothetical protein